MTKESIEQVNDHLRKLYRIAAAVQPFAQDGSGGRGVHRLLDWWREFRRLAELVSPEVSPER